MYMDVARTDLLDISDVMYKSNEASLGGAVYIVGVEDRQTTFSSCVFENNKAADGGAVYLYTGPGVDIFTGSIFRDNFACELSITASVKSSWSIA